METHRSITNLFLLTLWISYTYAQTGFLSLLCGGSENFSKDNISWISDEKFINVGLPQTIVDPGLPSYLQNLRYFPPSHNKSCYNLPLEPTFPYLVRLWFRGSMSHSGSFSYSIETQGTLFTYSNLTISQDSSPQYSEYVIKSPSNNLFICFIRIPQMDDDPFVNAIELRQLMQGMYKEVQPGTLLRIRYRWDIGNPTTAIRYPNDAFDRIWEPFPFTDKSITVGNYDLEKIPNRPPSIVMQTDYPAPEQNLTFAKQLQSSQVKARTMLYYLTQPATVAPKSSYFVALTNLYYSFNVTLLVSSQTGQNTGEEKIQLIYNGNISIAARESYDVIITEIATNSLELQAITSIKEQFGIQEWLGDPCYVIPWEGITCGNKSINTIIMSTRNISTTIPASIEQLSELQYLYLDNNRLSGSIPNLSRLTKLEILHLHNNFLSGSIPNWLSNLPNLKELFLQNNNFNGFVPPELSLKNPSLKINIDGNPLLSQNFTFQPSQKHGGQNARIIGLSIAVCICVVVIGLVSLFLCKICRKKQKVKTTQEGTVVEDTQGMERQSSNAQLDETGREREDSNADMYGPLRQNADPPDSTLRRDVILSQATPRPH